MVYIFNGLTYLPMSTYELMGEIFQNLEIHVLNLLSAFRNHKVLATH